MCQGGERVGGNWMSLSILENSTTLTNEPWRQHFNDRKKTLLQSRGNLHTFLFQDHKKKKKTIIAVTRACSLINPIYCGTVGHWPGVCADWSCIILRQWAVKMAHTRTMGGARRSMALSPHLGQSCKSAINKCWFRSPALARKRDIFHAHKM